MASMSVDSFTGPKVPSSFTGRFSGCTSIANMEGRGLAEPDPLEEDLHILQDILGRLGR